MGGMVRKGVAAAGSGAARRARLEGLLAHLERRTEKVVKDLGREAGPLSGSFEERATTLGNDDVLVALATEGIDQIEFVRGALARMDDGTYGTCATCGALIGEARLDALPYALRCIGCASSGAETPVE